MPINPAAYRHIGAGTNDVLSGEKCDSQDQYATDESSYARSDTEHDG